MQREQTYVDDQVLLPAELNAIQDNAAARDWVGGLLVWSETLSSLDGATVGVGAVHALVFPTSPGTALGAAAASVGVAKLEGGGSFVADTWYYLYAYNNAGAIDYQLSTTAPDAARVWKTGSTGTHRYLGCVRAATAGALVPFVARRGRYLYRPTATGVDLTVLAAGTATSWTSVTLSDFVPLTASSALLRVFLHTATGDPGALLAPSGGDTGSATESLALPNPVPTAANTYGYQDVEVPHVTSLVSPYHRTVQYKFTGATVSSANFLAVDVRGFQE